MSIHNEQLMIALIQHVKSGYVTLHGIVDQLQICPFNALTPTIIEKLAIHIRSNPNILAEAISLKEWSDVMSGFYGSERLSETIINYIVASRDCNPDWYTRNIIIETNYMREYFTDAEKLREFLNSNPVYVGLYIFVFIKMSI